MDKILVELLQEVKKDREDAGALKALHERFGFNYNKPIKAVKFHDSFTATTLKNIYGIDCNNNKVVVIFHKGKWFELADFTNGKVETVGGSVYPLSTISTKSEFNEWRKDGWYDVYVIAQSYAFLSDVRRRERYCNALDVNTRYELYDPTRDWYGVIEYGAKKVWEDKISAEWEDFDKSGYPVDVKREALKRQVLNNRAEREKQAYKEMTNTAEMISKVKEAIERKKIELSTRLLNCNDSNAINEFSRKLNGFSGLYGCYDDIEDIVIKDNEKRFRSPEDFNNAIARIYRRLAEI